MYFLALELNAQIPLQPGGEKEAILLEKGTALIASCTEHVTSHAFSDQSDEVQKLMNLFKKYHRSLVELEQAETLMGLDMGIDVLRFAQEEDYRQEIILSLARCGLSVRMLQCIQVCWVVGNTADVLVCMGMAYSFVCWRKWFQVLLACERDV